MTVRLLCFTTTSGCEAAGCHGNQGGWERQTRIGQFKTQSSLFLPVFGHVFLKQWLLGCCKPLFKSSENLIFTMFASVLLTLWKNKLSKLLTPPFQKGFLIYFLCDHLTQQMSVQKYWIKTTLTNERPYKQPTMQEGKRRSCFGPQPLEWDHCPAITTIIILFHRKYLLTTHLP